MADFALSNLALKAICPTNDILLDTAANGAELPGVYVEVGAKTLSALLTDGDGSVHPAFLVGGIQRRIWIGKFPGYQGRGRIYSLPGEAPGHGTLDVYVQRCRNKGPGHHCITAAEWAFLALWCKKNGPLPKGNNDYGKGDKETDYVALPADRTSDGRTTFTLPGTGPLTWSHDQTAAGIWDLVGNVWEWTPGLRLVKGELQVIPYNDAADPNTDLSSSSNAWRAVNGNATSYNDLYLTPNGSGTTANSVKLDYADNIFSWGKTISTVMNGAKIASFGNISSSGLSGFAKLYLQAMALLPEDRDTGYDGLISVDNSSDEACVLRGGGYNSGNRGGMFTLLFEVPTANNSTFGGRPACYE